MFTIALSTGSLYTYGLARVFELAAEAGFDAIEVMIDHRWDSRQPTYLRRLSEESELPIAAIHSPFKPSVPGWPHDSLGRLQETVALTREVGAGVVVAHLPLPIPLGGEKAYRSFLLNGLAQFEKDQGVKIGMENMPVKHFIGRGLDIHWLNDLGALAQMPHLTLDTTHIGIWELDLLAVYERLKERIVHVHLSNFDGKDDRLAQPAQAVADLPPLPNKPSRSEVQTRAAPANGPSSGSAAWPLKVVGSLASSQAPACGAVTQAAGGWFPVVTLSTAGSKPAAVVVICASDGEERAAPGSQPPAAESPWASKQGIAATANMSVPARASRLARR